MTTISIKENLDLSQTHFDTLEDFEMYVVALRQQSDLSTAHQTILDQRLTDRSQNPDDTMSVEELKASLRRK